MQASYVAVGSSHGRRKATALFTAATFRGADLGSAGWLSLGDGDGKGQELVAALGDLGAVADRGAALPRR
ncbi:MAG TPA: hypothetical protein VFE92_19810 [Dermatophilaceae bacterium]|nr:hypothetical protein [Dermatophilaceae bacterium]